MSDFDFSTAYKVDGYRGIAWRAIEYAKDWTEETWEYCGEGDPDDEANYYYIEPQEFDDKDRVVCIMVGDDTRYTFEIEELTPISEEEYCPECGQIGCKAYG